MADKKRPDIPARVTAGMDKLDFVLAGEWYMDTSADEGGRPPGITGILACLAACDDPKRGEETRRIAADLAKHPHLGMGPYDDEGPDAAAELDTEWQRVMAKRRAAKTFGELIYNNFVADLRAFGLDPNYEVPAAVPRKQIAA